MFGHLVSHVRHNVVAYVGLFVALGGTSYAAVSLPKNSVGSKQLKKHAVTPTKVAPKTVRLFKGEKGDRGPQGSPGQPGTSGVLGYAEVANGTVVADHSSNVVAAKAVTGTYCLKLVSGTPHGATVTPMGVPTGPLDVAQETSPPADCHSVMPDAQLEVNVRYLNAYDPDTGPGSDNVGLSATNDPVFVIFE